MTVVVAFLCTDGVVVAVDSMITPSMGNINVGHHKGLKVHVLAGPQLFAFAGDQGQGARFKVMADSNHGLPATQALPLDYPIALSQGIFAQFTATGIGNKIGVNTILAYMHGGACQCCVFEGALQPRLLDEHHYYVALGIGKMSADPFLRFLVDIFCKDGPPSVREAIFLATWVIEHVIDTNPGGVAGPIRIAVFERNDAGTYVAHALPETEIEEHKQAVESAAEALRKWREDISSGDAAEGVPQPPEAPEEPIQPDQPEAPGQPEEA